MCVCVASRTSVFVVGVPVMKEKKGDIYIYITVTCTYAVVYANAHSILSFIYVAVTKKK